MIDTTQLIELGVVGVISVFFTNFWKRISKIENKTELSHDKHIEIEGRVKVLEEKIPNEIQNMTVLVNLKLESLEKSFSDKFDLLESTIKHAEKSMVNQGDAFIKLYEMKKND